jgi:hypothetical protein
VKEFDMRNRKGTQENTHSKAPYDWIEKHGVNFISEALWELGHPSEPVETLIDVIKNVSEISETFIVNQDDAVKLVKIIGELEVHDSKIEAKRRQLRINARNSRTLCESRKTPWDPPSVLGGIKLKRARK